MVETLMKHIGEIIKNDLSWEIKDGNIELSKAYNEELSLETIQGIIDAENPKMELENVLYEWADDYAYEYGYDALLSDIRQYLSDEEKEVFDENKEEIDDHIRESVYFYYNSSDFNRDINVNVMVNSGNWDNDCVADDILNWKEGEIPQNSSMLWLAHTQRRTIALRHACRKAANGEEISVTDPFVVSAIEELQNLGGNYGTVTFLIKIPLLTLIDMIEDRAHPDDTTSLVFDKKSMCGLYSPWDGAGSLLEIDLRRDVEIPLKMCIFDIDGSRTHGYDVGNVYGLSDCAWAKNALKAIKKGGNHD